MSKQGSGRNLKYNSPRPIVKGMTYQANSSGTGGDKQSKGEAKSVNQSLNHISKQKFSSSSQVIKLPTMQGKKGNKDDNWFMLDQNNSQSNADILSPKRTSSPTNRYSRPKANSQYSNSGHKGQELNQNITTTASKSKIQGGVSISMAQTLPSNNVTHSQSM